MLFTTSFLLLFTLPAIQANTEIINFAVSDTHGPDLSLTNRWLVLSPENNEHEWILPPAALGTPLKQVCNIEDVVNESRRLASSCPHELWVVLDLARSWSGYSKFTLRLSWPASFPADFDIQIYDYEALSAHFGQDEHGLPNTLTPERLARREYARIRVVDTGVPTPRKSRSTNASSRPIPFIIILEPLYLGILPPTVIPVLWYLLLVVVVAAFAVPRIERFLRQIASQANKELEQGFNRDKTGVKDE